MRIDRVECESALSRIGARNVKTPLFSREQADGR
jgi:hypothetical protein